MTAELDRRELHGVAELADLVEARAAGRPRLIVGIVGAPGAGKSTLAAALVDELNARGCAGASLPMDGFHRSQAELVRLGRRNRMGAADTFDVVGYRGALIAARDTTADLRAPGFDRGIEEPVPDAVLIPAGTRVVVTEGNWLLLQDDGWGAVAAQLDVAVAVLIDDALRIHRLIERHVEHGKSLSAATAWVRRSDEANARRILPTLARADLAIRLPHGE